MLDVMKVNDAPTPLTPRTWLSSIGRKGGSARTPAQQQARKANLALGRKVRLEKLRKAQSSRPAVRHPLPDQPE